MESTYRLAMPDSVSPRSLAAGGVEVTRRATGERRTAPLPEVEAFLRSGSFAT
ncbi:MAG: hypothetical protein L0227_07120 [Chloroflexi bacterium]|nr:hypothetical protein [Chloroflexota bacterium]